MTAHRARPTPEDELRTDRRREERLLWKGILSVLVVVAVVYVRQRYLI